MTTPTLSMQIWGEMNRKEGIKRRQSEAAKKAWKTRRKLAKISPTMKKVLTWLSSHKDGFLALHYHGKSIYYVSFSGAYSMWYDKPRRITVTTFRAMKKRGLLAFVRRRDSGGTMGTLPNGKQGIVKASFDLDYTISEKGRKVLVKETAKGISK